ncbi:unnamed protein product [Lymnaea stagnalis]|uniref:G-protein coupled receptors family 1 profile domain-containing protein n=1 Tax=Lymnaea stagnalis TaxID=6523 RepID=A0AAV2HF83_LYMST
MTNTSDMMADFSGTTEKLLSISPAMTYFNSASNYQSLVTSSKLSISSMSPANVFATTTAKVCSTLIDAKCYPLVMAAYYFTMYGTYLSFAVGIPGSFITTIILLRMKPFNSSILWLISLNCTDCLNLTIRLIINLTENNGIPFSDWSCKLFNIMAETLEFSAYYYVVGLTVERFIAVWFPLKMSIWCTKQRAVVGILSVLTACLCQSLYIVEVYRVNVYSWCVMRVKYLGFWGITYQHQIQPTLMMLIPIVSLAVLNALIVRRLDQARKFQKQMSDVVNKEKSKQQQQINRMLLADSIWLFLCVTPDLCYRYSDQFLGREEDDNVARLIMMNVFGVLRMYNSAVNFILYIIAAKKFRTELIKLVTCNRFVGIDQRASSISQKHGLSETKVTSTSVSYTTGT